jgi:hypothetical protein
MKRPAYSSERVARSDERRPASRSFVARIAWSSPRMADSAPRTDESASPCAVSAARRSLGRSARAFFLPSSSPRVARHAERPSGHSDGGTIDLPGACRRVPGAALRSHRLPRSAERRTIDLPGGCRRVPRAALRSHRLPRSAERRTIDLPGGALHGQRLPTRTERGTIDLPSISRRTSGRCRCSSRPCARSSRASRLAAGAAARSLPVGRANPRSDVLSPGCRRGSFGGSGHPTGARSREDASRPSRVCPTIRLRTRCKGARPACTIAKVSARGRQ